jgi:hypothetical protein
MNNPNQNGMNFTQNTMQQLQQASQNLGAQLRQMNVTPQQYLEQAMQNGSVSQERYNWARDMANKVLGTNY